MTSIEELIPIIVIVVIGAIFVASGIKIIRPVERSIVETLGKFSRIQSQGITFIIPFVQKIYRINITEQIVNIDRQSMITKDNLNCIVDGQVYYKVKEDPDQIKNAIYKVNDYKYQIVQLAQTTLRNVIGGNQFKEVNSNRKVLNNLVFESIKDKTDSWAIEIVRVELKEIDPPEDVQSTMNEIIKAENTRDANKDFALARAIEAEGIANAAIKSAEGEKRSLQLRAEGQALAIKEVALARAKEIEYVNNAAKTYFVDNAVLLKQLEVTQASLQNNTKIVLTKDGISPTLVLSEEQKIIPVKENPKTAGDK